jgi:invasion protein IalB
MIRLHRTTFITALALSVFAGGSLTAAAVLADDAPPPSSAPAAAAPKPHHSPAWQACKKQADSARIPEPDGMREFMKSCLQSAKDAAPPAPPAS